MNPTPRDRRTDRAVRRLLKAARDTVAAAEELKKAHAALSLEATRPPLRIVPGDQQGQEGGRDQ
jgi:hypothetical protein